MLSNLKYQFILLMCDISREDWQPLCKMQRGTFPRLSLPDHAVRGKLLFYASFFLKPSTYCSKILMFRHGCGVTPALS